MSTEPSSQTGAPQYDYDGHIMRTPDEWCRIHQVEILDADGWRGSDAKPWDEPLTELDFMERLNVCTQRSIATQPAGQLCGCPIFTTHPTHGNPWCSCGHPYGAHDTPGAACNDPACTLSPVSNELVGIAWSATHGVHFNDIRTALEAAYPAIRQQVAQQIAVAIRQHRDTFDTGSPIEIELAVAEEIACEFGGGQ